MPIYIGAYLKVPLKPTWIPEGGNICGNSECENHERKIRVRFCPFCGSAAVLNERKIEEMRGYQFSELDNQHEDELMTIDPSYGAEQGYQYLLPNSEKAYSMRIDENDTGEFPYPPNAEQTDRELFQQHYGELAEAIMKEFPGTELKIGMVGYY